MQAGMVLEKDPRVLHLNSQVARRLPHIEHRGDLLVCLILLPPRPHLPVVPLPMDQAFKHMSL